MRGYVAEPSFFDTPLEHDGGTSILYHATVVGIVWEGWEGWEEWPGCPRFLLFLLQSKEQGRAGGREGKQDQDLLIYSAAAAATYPTTTSIPTTASTATYSTLLLHPRLVLSLASKGHH